MPASRSELEIRPVRPGEEPLLLDLIRELADYERMADEVEATPALLHAALFGDRPSAEAVIAAWHREPAGFALFFQNFSTFVGVPGLYLEDLYVREPVRGNGIGKALLLHVARLAARRGCGRMEWSVLDWNEPAIEFYHRLGARPMDDWTVFRLDRAGLRHLAGNGPAD